MIFFGGGEGGGGVRRSCGQNMAAEGEGWLLLAADIGCWRTWANWMDLKLGLGSLIE